VACGLVAYLCLPKSLQTAAFLSQDERDYATLRLSGHLLVTEKRFKYVDLLPSNHCLKTTAFRKNMTKLSVGVK
jgi:hypothetical protein